MWHLPLRVHLAALAVLLLLLLPVVGTGSSFSADEGAAIVQAKSLSHGDGWIVEHPFAEVDSPTGDAYPLENSEVGEKGRAPFAKHPLYALLLAGADRLAGVTGMVMLSLAGTVMAAGLAALLARRLDDDLMRPVLWVVGAGSPLLFDGFLVMAHTLAAAAAAATVLLALRAVESRSVGALLAVGPAVATGVFLRSEFMLFAAALAAVAVVMVVAAMVERRRSVVPAFLATVVLVAAVASRLAERAWTAAIVGPPTGASGAAPLPSGGLGGRVRGFVLTWFTAGYGGLRPAHLALVAMLVAGVLAAYVLRRNLPAVVSIVPLLAVVSAGAAAMAVALRPANIVPGLLVAFPLAAVGLVLVRRETLRSTTAQLCFGTFVMFAVAVAATQYERGGSGEWGGRYFALGLPVLAPVLLLAVRDGGARLTMVVRQVGVRSLVVVMLALSVMSVAGLRSAHEHNRDTNRAVAELAAGVPGVDPPVIVASDGALARLGWPLFDGGRWLLAGADVSDLATRLNLAGVREFVYLARSGIEVPPGLTVLERRAGASWSVSLVSTG